MSQPLHAFGRPLPGLRRPVLGRVTTEPVGREARPDHVLLVAGEPPGDVGGYAGLLLGRRLERPEALPLDLPGAHGLSRIDHLADGDVVGIQPGGYVRTLYRRASPHNALFATDRCNSFCLMCSQPPRPVDDEGRLAEQLRLIELIDPETLELGITGGEPTLLKKGLVEIVRRCHERLPNTALHILSNGRLFYYGSFARDLASVGHPDLMIGVPLYADTAAEHDYVVQARGAFGQTMIGLQNLARYGVRVEIRVVLHRETYRRLPALAEMIYRNLPFAAHVAFMGLEPMGFAVPNLDRLWIDPWDYREELREAVLALEVRGLTVSIYNLQLCVVPSDLRRFCRRSISDWKNDYLPECYDCAARKQCAGFFTSAIRRRYSAHVSPLTASPDLALLATA